MLALSRKLYEKVLIGGGVTVTVLYIDRTKVRLGFETPDGVGIWREEVVTGRCGWTLPDGSAAPAVCPASERRANEHVLDAAGRQCLACGARHGGEARP